MIIQAGIKEVIFLSDKYFQSSSNIASRRMFTAAGVAVRQHIPQRNVSIDFISLAGAS